MFLAAPHSSTTALRMPYRFSTRLVCDITSTVHGRSSKVQMAHQVQRRLPLIPFRLCQKELSKLGCKCSIANARNPKSHSCDRETAQAGFKGVSQHAYLVVSSFTISF